MLSRLQGLLYLLGAVVISSVVVSMALLAGVGGGTCLTLTEAMLLAVRIVGIGLGLLCAVVLVLFLVALGMDKLTGDD